MSLFYGFMFLLFYNSNYLMFYNFNYRIIFQKDTYTITWYDNILFLIYYIFILFLYYFFNSAYDFYINLFLWFIFIIYFVKHFFCENIFSITDKNIFKIKNKDIVFKCKKCNRTLPKDNNIDYSDILSIRCNECDLEKKIVLNIGKDKLNFLYIFKFFIYTFTFFSIKIIYDFFSEKIDDNLVLLCFLFLSLLLFFICIEILFGLFKNILYSKIKEVDSILFYLIKYSKNSFFSVNFSLNDIRYNYSIYFIYFIIFIYFMVFIIFI